MTLIFRRPSHDGRELKLSLCLAVIVLNGRPSHDGRELKLHSAEGDFQTSVVARRMTGVN